MRQIGVHAGQRRAAALYGVDESGQRWPAMNRKLRRRSKAQLRATAFHEAAHAVAMSQLGIRFLLVEIYSVPKECILSNGQCGFSLGCVVHDPGFKIGGYRQLDEVLCQLAGPRATKRLKPWLSWTAVVFASGQEDYNQAMNLAKELNLDLSSYERTARELVTMMWSEITAVAERLLVRKELSFEEVCAIINAPATPITP